MLPLLHIEGRVATITLRRSALANKLTPADLPALRAHFKAVDETPEVLALVLRGQGRHFCSGYDISEVGDSQSEGAGFGDMVDALEHCRPVTVAVLQGGAYGGATDMALACDFRVGSDKAEMFMPAARLGLHFYQSGLERYVTRLGLDMAKRLFLTAEKLDAQAMRECGFLTHLVAAPTLDAEVERLCAGLSAMAPLALLGMKKHLNRIARNTVDAQALRADVMQSVASSDLQEGALAWRQKRAPVFTGR